MTDIGFYHCTKASPEDVAVRLTARAWAARERLLVVAAPDTLDRLDHRLWTDDPESFLPHGRAADRDRAADQPILLAERPEPLNAARLLLLVEEPLPDLPAPFVRILNLFADGSEAHARAREEWRQLSALPGISRTYWKQDARGRWARAG
ncbi:DNA polymerase III subunit chi [Thermaurantiacus sp.]